MDVKDVKDAVAVGGEDGLGGLDGLGVEGFGGLSKEEAFETHAIAQGGIWMEEERVPGLRERVEGEEGTGKVSPARVDPGLGGVKDEEVALIGWSGGGGGGGGG